jgi:hypothetical protein
MKTWKQRAIWKKQKQLNNCAHSLLRNDYEIVEAGVINQQKMLAFPWPIIIETSADCVTKLKGEPKSKKPFICCKRFL